MVKSCESSRPCAPGVNIDVAACRYLTLALEASGEVIFLTSPDGVFSYVNPEFVRVYGYEPHEVVGCHTPRLLKGGRCSPDDYEALWAQLQRGEVARREFVNKTKAGASVLIESSMNPIVESGRCVGYLAVQRDITARKATEQALRDSEARYRTLAEASEDLIFIVNRDAVIDFANAATLERFGLQEHDILGRSLHDALPFETADQIWRSMWQVFETGQRSSFERRFRTSAGEIWLEAWLAPMTGSNGVSAVMSVARDVTARKRLEQQYVQAQKMEAIGRLAGGIAHDFNNILTVIMGYSEQLQDRMSQDSEALGDVDEVKTASERAARLTRQLLAFSRQQVLAPKVLDLNTVVGELQRLLSRVIGEDVRLEVKTQVDLGRTRVDPGQMEQLLLNLAVNARDAMPQGGRLTIATANATIDEAFVRDHEGAHCGAYVTLSVADTGCGMTEDVLAHAFEPFFTTKPEGKGTGLGLSTVFGVVQQSGGFLTIDSAPGRGTEVTAWLPVSHDVVEPAAAPARISTSGHETILLVEDDENIRRLMGWTLERRGYTVLAAETPAKAVELAQNWPGEIDLLLSDVVMPEASGPDLARRMVRARPNLRVLYVSGYPNRVGADDLIGRSTAFLAKPFAPQLLVATVRECLDFSRKSFSTPI